MGVGVGVQARARGEEFVHSHVWTVLGCHVVCRLRGVPHGKWSGAHVVVVLRLIWMGGVGGWMGGMRYGFTDGEGEG